MTLLVVRPAAEEAEEVPMIRAPAPWLFVELRLLFEAFEPIWIVAALLEIDRKSVITSTPLSMPTSPWMSVEIPRISQAPVPFFDRLFMPAPLISILPVTTVTPVPLRLRVRSDASSLFHALPVKVSVPPMLLVMVLLLSDEFCVQAWNVIP